MNIINMSSPFQLIVNNNTEIAAITNFFDNEHAQSSSRLGLAAS